MRARVSRSISRSLLQSKLNCKYVIPKGSDTWGLHVHSSPLYLIFISSFSISSSPQHSDILCPHPLFVAFLHITFPALSVGVHLERLTVYASFYFTPLFSILSIHLNQLSTSVCLYNPIYGPRNQSQILYSFIFSNVDHSHLIQALSFLGSCDNMLPHVVLFCLCSVVSLNIQCSQQKCSQLLLLEIVCLNFLRTVSGSSSVIIILTYVHIYTCAHIHTHAHL